MTPETRLGGSPRRRGPWAARLLLLLILLLGAYFRTISLTDWDSGTGQHPDERFFSDVASTVRLPASLGELYDSARSPLNPRSYDKFPLYVYGPFPIIAARAVAVSLTPPEQLPETVPSLNGPPQAGLDATRPNDVRTNYGPQVANPERSFPRLLPLQLLLNPEGRNLTGYGEIQKVGRGLAALLDLGAILLIYLIGRRLFGVRAGLLAAFLAACAVMPIQQAHFFVDPIYSTFFCLLSLYWAVRLAQGGGWMSASLLGLSIGAAMANRITMATLGLTAIVAMIVWCARPRERSAPSRREAERGSANPSATGLEDEADGVRPAWTSESAAREARDGFVDRLLMRGLPLLVLAGGLTLLSFRTLAPDAFLGSAPDAPVLAETASFLQGAGFLDVRPEPRFLGNLGAVRGLVSGEVDFPPSQQWVGRAPYLFPWLNMVRWGMGPALGLAAWGGFAAFLLIGLRRLLWPRPDDPPFSPAWVLAAWICFYFAWQGNQFAITLRYLLPIYGALIVFAAWGLVRLWAFGAEARARRIVFARWLRVVPVVVVLATAGWAYAFTRIYTQPHSRVLAAQWLAEHAPPGSYVISEIWDDALPLQATDAGWGSTYEGISSAPYAEDEPRKYAGGPNGSGGFDEGLLDQLDRADYITLTSNRVYDSTSRLRMRYPALMRYYHHLFEGTLGFRLVAEITSYPSLLGVEIPDQSAEEAFHVYDHPRVLIFEKTPAYSRAQAEALITDGTLWQEVYKSPVIIADRNPTALRLTDSQWPRYTAGGTWAERFSRDSLVNAVAPLLWIGVLELLGLAGFFLLFRLLPGLPDRGYSLAKILGLLVVAYLAWLLGSLGNGAGVPGNGALAGVGLGPLPLPFAPATLWLCASPLLIAGAYAGWSGRDELARFWRERRAALISAEAIFLGFTLLGLLLRWLNPDLWHPARGGEKPMDLAYFTAVLRSSAFPPYDPWHAGGYINYYYFGFVIVGALTQLTTVLPSIAYNLAVGTLFGLTALGAWGVVYNLLASRERLEHEPTSAPLPRERRALVAAGLAPALLLLLGNLAQAFWFINGYAAEQGPKGRPEWAYWDATRIVPGTVNEFPFFTFLFGDLHAHMIVMPLSLALLGLAFASNGLMRGAGGRVLDLLRFALYVLLLGLLAGAIRVTNTWDYPSFVGLAALTLLLLGWRATRANGAGWSPALRLLIVALPAAAMIALGNLFFAPFTASFATESSGAELLREGLAPSLLEQILLAQRTSAWDLLRLYGHWLFFAGAAWLTLILRIAGPQAAATGALALSATLLGAALLGLPAVVLLLPLLAIVAWSLWRLHRAPLALLLPALWLGAALGLAAMVELVVVKGDVGRMNTVFKFGLHTWVLFALGSAALLPSLWQTASRRFPRAGVTAQYAIRGGLMLLGIAALVYPLTATPARAADRWAPEAPRSLDGAAYMAAIGAERHGTTFSLNEDAAAIDWLQRNVAGTPVILEAHLPSYQWAGRVATNTGLPTLLGWEWHQIQQRNVVGAGPVIAARQQTISQIYNTPDPADALAQLRDFGVAYVMLGGVERATYDPAGLAKFEQLAQSGELEQVFQQGQTAIYRVVEPGNPGMLTSDLTLVVPTDETIPPLMLATPVQALSAVDEYAWNRLLGDNSLLAALLWLLALYGIGALGLPLAHVALGRRAGGWHTGGASWAKLIGLLLLGYAVWLPTSLGLWQFDRWGLVGGLSLVLLLNVGILWWLGASEQNNRTAEQQNRGAAEGVADEAAEGAASRWRARAQAQPASPVALGYGELVRELRAHRRGVLAGEAVFLAGFLVLALIRAANPDLWHPTWGGEKPMEFGFLNAILRSPVMPPYDPFFSGGYINYYYYGLYLVALPIKLTGIDPAIGFNLAVASVFGLSLAGAFAVVARLTGQVRYGLLAAALVGVLGNLASFFAAGWSRGALGIIDALRGGGLAGLGARLGDWYIGPSRVIPQTINEFPAFTFLFADLHPHMIALPITLLVVALAYRFLERRRARGHEGESAGAQEGRSEPSYPLALALTALALGTLAVTNSWDFPTYGLLAGLALLGAAWRAGGPRARGVPWAGLARAAALAVAVGVGGLLLYAPFFDRYYAPVGGIGTVAWGDGTVVRDYLLIYGLFIAALLPLLAGAVWRASARRPLLTAPSPVTLGISALPAASGGPWVPLAALGALLLVGLAVPALGLRLVLAALLLLCTVLLLRRGLGSPAWYALLLAWIGWAVSLGVELVYIRDHLDGGDWYRMNTVFKFGLQVWVLLALAAAASLPALLRGLRRIGGPASQQIGLALLGGLALLAALYPVAGTASRVANRIEVQTGPTLDGLAFLDQASFEYDCAAFGGCEPGVERVTVDLSGDGPAIRWLNENIAGTPIVVQSDLWFYRAYGIRVAANTGLPTVVSALHVNEQRDPQLAGERSRDVDEFFRTTDVETALRFLGRYRVGYVYVGGVERAFYPAGGLAKFDQMRDIYLTPVYTTNQVQIYQVTGVPESYARPIPYDFANDAPVAAPATAPQPLPAGATPAGLEELIEANAASPTDGPLAFGLAERYRELGRLADAAAVLEPAARANPADTGVLHLWGDILAQAGRYPDAEEAYLLAARAVPTAGNWNKLGTALLEWGEFDKAEIALSQAVAADPQSPDPYFQLGRLFAQRGDAERAANELSVYLQLAPDGPWAEPARQLLGELGQ